MKKKGLFIMGGLALALILIFTVIPTVKKTYETNRKKISETYMNEGRDYFREGLFDKAGNRYKEALTIDPNYVDARLMLATSYINRGNYPGAESELLRAIEIQPQLAGAHFLLGYTYHLENKYDLAIVEYEKTLTMNPNAELTGITLNNLADIYMIKGLLEEAKLTIEEALRINPNLGSAYVTLAQIYEKQGKYPEALEALKNLEDPSVELSPRLREEADILRAKIEGLMKGGK